MNDYNDVEGINHSGDTDHKIDDTLHAKISGSQFYAIITE